jgi:hypothetical protein
LSREILSTGSGDELIGISAAGTITITTANKQKKANQNG